MHLSFFRFAFRHLAFSLTRRHVLLGFALMLSLGTSWSVNRATAQSLWEVTPYEVQVWVVLQPHPRVDPSWGQTLPAEMERLASSQLRGIWKFAADLAPNSLRGDLLRRQPLTLQELSESNSEVRILDKLICLHIEDDHAGYRVTAQEFDVNARRWAPAQSVRVVEPSLMASQALRLVCEVFAPLVRIETIDDQQVTASLRAIALNRPDESPRRWKTPIEIDTGELLRPFSRHADRSGNVGPDGVKPVEWTVMIAEEVSGAKVTCRFESGYRQPFNTRRSARLDQLALRIHPVLPSTTLKLVNRKDPNQPLVGYELYAKTSGEGEKEQTEFVGRTDWKGEVTIPRPEQDTVEVLFVRNGRQLLGKLPIVPGQDAELLAPLRNDDLRLEAEGFLIGVQDSLVDLVARREVMASRIRRLVDEGEFDKANELLRELRRLDTQDDFTRRVQQRQQDLTSMDDQVRQKINQLFSQTTSLLSQYLSQDQVDRLSEALAAARRQQ